MARHTKKDLLEVIDELLDSQPATYEDCQSKDHCTWCGTPVWSTKRDKGYNGEPDCTNEDCISVRASQILKDAS